MVAELAIHLLLASFGVALIARISRNAVPPWPLVRVRDVTREVVLTRAAVRSPWTRADVRDVVVAATDLPSGGPPLPLWISGIVRALILLGFAAFVIAATAP